MVVVVVSAGVSAGGAAVVGTSGDSLVVAAVSPGREAGEGSGAVVDTAGRLKQRWGFLSQPDLVDLTFERPGKTLQCFKLRARPA